MVRTDCCCGLFDDVITSTGLSECGDACGPDFCRWIADVTSGGEERAVGSGVDGDGCRGTRVRGCLRTLHFAWVVDGVTCSLVS
jgi:hypothetical protein